MQVIDYHEAIFASKLTSNARLTALAISKFYNWKEKQACWPSNNTLSEATGLSIRSIIRAKQELVNTGYLMSQRQYNNACLYIPCVPESAPLRLTVNMALPVWQLNNEYNNEVNNEKNNEKNNKNNQTSFDNSINLINTGEVINVSSETIASGSALRKELTPAEIDELLSW
jgi:DNA-binding transcriptional MocR family regulator